MFERHTNNECRKTMTESKIDRYIASPQNSAGFASMVRNATMPQQAWRGGDAQDVVSNHGKCIVVLTKAGIAIGVYIQYRDGESSGLPWNHVKGLISAANRSWTHSLRNVEAMEVDFTDLLDDRLPTVEIGETTVEREPLWGAVKVLGKGDKRWTMDDVYEFRANLCNAYNSMRYWVVDKRRMHPGWIMGRSGQYRLDELMKEEQVLDCVFLYLRRRFLFVDEWRRLATKKKFLSLFFESPIYGNIAFRKHENQLLRMGRLLPRNVPFAHITTDGRKVFRVGWRSIRCEIRCQEGAEKRKQSIWDKEK